MFLKITIISFIAKQLIVINCLNSCEVHNTCGKCIQNPLCKWCTVDNLNEARCIAIQDTYTDSRCNNDFTENPQNDEPQKIRDQPFSSDPNNVIQIKPQKYQISLRVGQPLRFNFTFKGADNYPADLYFLIDASKSMEPTFKYLSSTSKQIYEEMKTNTNNIYSGIGTFIDKNALPFVKTLNDKDTTYSFKHHLNLTSDQKTFKDTLHIKLGSNYDYPEGGMDALAQVMACSNQIGWRKESRKIIIFMTDAQSHFVGDGKWAGIVQPYDGKCYLDNETYTMEKKMDYPSLGIINKLISENDMIIIFAIVIRRENHVDYYENLAKQIKGSVVFGIDQRNKRVKIKGDSLGGLLSTIYKTISHNIKLKVDMDPQARKYIDIRFDPDCSDSLNDNKATCKVATEKEKIFEGSINVKKYFGINNIPIKISIEGLHEKLILNVDIKGNCNCEVNKIKIEYNSSYCNKNGDKKCGICDCSPNKEGDRCGCPLEEIAKNKCMMNGTLCSSHGRCSCGQCNCHPGYHGKYCECSDYGCDKKNNCNNRGKCFCGNCIDCAPGWEGEACDCSLEPCTLYKGTICNNRGICHCGECVCHPIPSYDARTKQDENCVIKPCTDCHSKQCRKLTECALCLHNNEKCSTVCGNIIVNVSKTISEESGLDYYNCENVKVDIGCYTRFLYMYDKDSIKIFVQTDKECVQTAYMFGAIFLTSLVAVGIGTLVIWKCLMDARDRREYERFVAEHVADKDGVCKNPIYEAPTTTFRNPAFRKN